jgi:hypothetical protein
MAHQGAPYGLPQDPRNPFAQQRQYDRDYPEEQYGNPNSSTTQLTAGQYYDQQDNGTLFQHLLS